MSDKRFLVLMLALVAMLAFSSAASAQNGWIWFDQSQVKQKQQQEETAKKDQALKQREEQASFGQVLSDADRRSHVTQAGTESGRTTV